MNYDLSKYQVLFDDDTTDIILNYIRNNIYKKYPYKSLSNSSLLHHFRFEKVEIDTEYITAGNGNKLYPYKYSIIFNVYYKDNFISSINYPKATIYNSKRNKEYLKNRFRQAIKFR